MTTPYSTEDNYQPYQVLKEFEVLPAAGAFDVPREISAVEFQSISIYLSYQRGSAVGKIQAKIELSPHSSDEDAPPNSAIWYQTTTIETGSIVAGTTLLAVIQGNAIELTPTSPETEGIIIGSFAFGGTSQRLRVSVAESGDTANPGACSVIMMGDKI